MQVKEMLKESQPVVYRILENGFKNKKTSHAYLISGEKGMPVKQTALFLAQSFLKCRHNFLQFPLTLPLLAAKIDSV